MSKPRQTLHKRIQALPSREVLKPVSKPAPDLPPLQRRPVQHLSDRPGAMDAFHLPSKGLR